MRRRRRRTHNRGLRFWFGLGFWRGCRWVGRGVSDVGGPLRRRLIAFYQVRRHTRFRARHSRGKKRLAVARKLFLGVEYVGIQHFRRVELTARRTTAEHEYKRKRRTSK